jgi:hypothetical protein
MDYKIPWWKKIFPFIEIIVGINILLVDILLMQVLMQKSIPFMSQKTHTITNTIVITPSPTIAITPLLSPPSIPQVQSVVQTSPLVKDYYVPFGTGQSIATTWTDVPGLQAYISSSSYPNSKKVVFEASIQVPTANQTAWVRLYDVSAQHPVWSSDMYFSGGANPQYLISQPIQLSSGNDLYQVQMQTQLGSPAVLTQSRIHITLQ